MDIRSGETIEAQNQHAKEKHAGKEKLQAGKEKMVDAAQRTRETMHHAGEHIRERGERAKERLHGTERRFGERAHRATATGLPSVKLGHQGLVVSKMGFGCMGITAFYGEPMKDADALALLKFVFDQGCNFFDTAELYCASKGDQTVYNETIVGEFARSVPRDKVVIATKYWPTEGRDYDLAGIEQVLDASLARLGLSFVDVYYLHRMPDTLEKLEQWMQSVGQLVKKGKVKFIGLSEVSPEWLRRAHAIFPVSVVQQEWSLLTRTPVEDHLVPVCRELGIGIVAYSPLARNLLTEQKDIPDDWRKTNPRYSPENFARNQQLTAQIAQIGQDLNASAAELSLAWLYKQAEKLHVNMVAIPGTTKIENAKSNLHALNVKLNDKDFKTLTDLGELVAGPRGDEQYREIGMEGQLTGENKTPMRERAAADMFEALAGLRAQAKGKEIHEVHRHNKPVGTMCEVPGCTRAIQEKGFCGIHSVDHHAPTEGKLAPDMKERGMISGAVHMAKEKLSSAAHAVADWAKPQMTQDYCEDPKCAQFKPCATHGH